MYKLGFFKGFSFLLINFLDFYTNKLDRKKVLLNTFEYIWTHFPGRFRIFNKFGAGSTFYFKLKFWVEN